MSSEEEVDFVVERILHEKLGNDGITQYLVKWEGFPYEQCSYEPVEHFNSQETLNKWRNQREHDTRLSQSDVERIEAQMADYHRRGTLKVEEILHQKKWEGKVKYFVKWAGYGEEECTWEPREHLGDPQLLKDWQRKWASGYRIDPNEYKRITKLRLKSKSQNYASCRSIVPSIEVEDLSTISESPQEPRETCGDSSSNSESKVPRKKRKAVTKKTTGLRAKGQNKPPTNAVHRHETGATRCGSVCAATRIWSIVNSTAAFSHQASVESSPPLRRTTRASARLALTTYPDVIDDFQKGRLTPTGTTPVEDKHVMIDTGSDQEQSSSETNETSFGDVLPEDAVKDFDSMTNIERLSTSIPLPSPVASSISEWHRIYLHSSSPMFFEDPDDHANILIKPENEVADTTNQVTRKDEISVLKLENECFDAFQPRNNQWTRDSEAFLAAKTHVNSRRKRLFHRSGSFDLGHSFLADGVETREEERQSQMAQKSKSTNSLPTSGSDIILEGTKFSNQGIAVDCPEEEYRRCDHLERNIHTDSTLPLPSESHSFHMVSHANVIPAVQSRMIVGLTPDINIRLSSLILSQTRASTRFGESSSDVTSARGTQMTMDESRMFVLLAFKDTSSPRMENLRLWLVSQRVPQDQIWDRGTQRNWSQFVKKLPLAFCIIIFDKNFPISRLQSLAKQIYENDNLVCWKLEYQDENVHSLAMHYLFPNGHALTISEASYVNDPDNVLRILMWLKAWTVNPYARCLLILPPMITEVMLQQARMAKGCITKKSFNELASLTEELLSDALPTLIYDSGNEGPTDSRRSKLSVIQSYWDSVYQDMVQDETLSTIEQRRKDEEKEKRLLSYFSTKTMSYYLPSYRHFAAIAFNKHKIACSGHIRILSPQAFMSTISDHRQRI